MRRALSLAGLVLVLGFGALWLAGALGPVADGLEGAQRAAHERLPGAIRSLRGGEPGALAAFWAVCFGHGVLHAAGPGHGKLVIGGYGVARRVPVGRLAGLALASSLAQAAVAVGLVYAALAVLGLTRAAVEGAAERWLTPMGHAMIAGLGLWLAWRGLTAMRVEANRREQSHEQSHSHDHDHNHHDDHGPHCNHAHGPTVEEVERVGSFRDGLALVSGIALRPCSGALFVLVLTWQLGIALAGVIGAFVIGLGTALVIVAAALMAVWAREGALAELGSGRIARAMPVIQLALGAVIAVAADGLLIRSL